jgi:exopolyphosphatase/pppGpp-phosphohydrolase
MTAPPVRLRLLARSTVLEFDDGKAVTMPVGLRDLAEDMLRHEPPTPAELERAIDVVEDALAASRLAPAERGDLVAAANLLGGLAGPGTADARLTRDEVEAQFQRLASRSLGTPVAETELPARRDFAAALVILRECMHHLGFGGVRLTTK